MYSTFIRSLTFRDELNLLHMLMACEMRRKNVLVYFRYGYQSANASITTNCIFQPRILNKHHVYILR